MPGWVGFRNRAATGLRPTSWDRVRGTGCLARLARHTYIHIHTHSLSLSLPDRDWRREIYRECLFESSLFRLRRTLGVARKQHKGKEEAKKGLGKLRSPLPSPPQHFSLPGIGQPERRRGGGFGHRLSFFLESYQCGHGSHPTQ